MLNIIDVTLNANFHKRILIDGQYTVNPLRLESSAFNGLTSDENSELTDQYNNYLAAQPNLSEYVSRIQTELASNWNDQIKLFFFCWACYNSLDLPTLLNYSNLNQTISLESKIIITTFRYVVDLLLKLQNKDTSTSVYESQLTSLLTGTQYSTYLNRVAGIKQDLVGKIACV